MNEIPESPAVTVTAGQSAHSRWLTTRWPDMTGQNIAKDWELISNQGKKAWEASAATEPAPGPGNESSGAALYPSAVARLTAALREVQHACERGDSPHAITPIAASALADVGRLQVPQSAPGPPMLALYREALEVAKAALKRLADCDYNPDNPGEQTFEIASDALATITDADL